MHPACEFLPSVRGGRWRIDGALAWPFGNGCLSTRCCLHAGAQALPGWPDCQGDCRLKLDVASGADPQYLPIQNDASARSILQRAGNDWTTVLSETSAFRVPLHAGL